MEDGAVIRLLADLGMDELSYKALPLLPLVQVAWADGEVQDKEAVLIETIAEDRWQVGPEGLLLLRNWLRYRPTEDYLRRGREALVAVARQPGDDSFDESILGDVVELSRRVAKSAGGLFGIGAISRGETDALTEIARALDIPAGTPLDKASAGALAKELGSSPRRVTITFAQTATLGAAAQDGVLEPDPSLGVHGKYPVTRDGLVIGSATEADIQVESDPGVSAMHARVFERNRKHYVQDLDSETGTWVNSERIAERRLIGGEEIRMGAVVLTFKRLRRIPKQMIE
jgi:hypothetical protein